MEVRDRLAKRLTDDGRIGVGGDLLQDITDAVRLIDRLRAENVRLRTEAEKRLVADHRRAARAGID